MEKMFRLLRANEIECRVATINEKGLSLLLYKDARVDQNILDETVGIYGWKRTHQLIGDRLYCTVEVRDPESGEWIAKQDVGVESYTEKEKGQASDSFKRACFNLGIGRELYTAPFIWLTPDKYNQAKGKNGQPTTYDRFTVSRIEYRDGAISFLEIRNKRNLVYTYGRPAAEETVTKAQAETLKNLMSENQTSWALKHYNVAKIEDLTTKAYTELVTALKKREDNENAGDPAKD